MLPEITSLASLCTHLHSGGIIAIMKRMPGRTNTEFPCQRLWQEYHDTEYPKHLCRVDLQCVLLPRDQIDLRETEEFIKYRSNIQNNKNQNCCKFYKSLHILEYCCKHDKISWVWDPS